MVGVGSGFGGRGRQARWWVRALGGHEAGVVGAIAAAVSVAAGQEALRGSLGQRAGPTPTGAAKESWGLRFGKKEEICS